MPAARGEKFLFIRADWENAKKNRESPRERERGEEKEKPLSIETQLEARIYRRPFSRRNREQRRRKGSCLPRLSFIQKRTARRDHSVLFASSREKSMLAEEPNVRIIDTETWKGGGAGSPLSRRALLSEMIVLWKLFEGIMKPVQMGTERE